MIKLLDHRQINEIQSKIRGKIIHASLSKEELNIQGTLRVIDPLTVTGFKVHFEGREYDVKQFILGDKSRSQTFVLTISLKSFTQRKYPSENKILKRRSSEKYFKLLRQGLAYFLPNLFVKLQQRKIRTHNPLFKVTPLLNDGTEGRSFYGLANILLPLPMERENRKIGGGNLIEISSEFLSLMVEEAGLKKIDHVLDIGCGLGRMAYALAYYLESNARYEGFDIMGSLITRAQRFISPYFSNFQFKHVNVWNSFYNPKGTEKSSSFRFPYEDQSFNFVLLTSVFSHMLTSDVRHYLSEISRVLQSSGRCLFSCFLLTDESKQLIKEKKSTQELIHPFGDNCYVVSLEYPEASIGYEENAIIDLIQQAGFKLRKILRGSWCGRTDYVSYQDIVIIEKA